MKTEVERSKWNFWASCMMAFMVLTPLSIAPALRFFYPYSMSVPIIFGVMMMAAALKVEKMKKQNKIETYSEILAYMENRAADTDKVTHEKRFKTRNTILMMAGSALIATVLAIIGFWIFL